MGFYIDLEEVFDPLVEEELTLTGLATERLCCRGWLMLVRTGDAVRTKQYDVAAG